MMRNSVLAAIAAVSLSLPAVVWAAEATVTKGDQSFRFVVLQCLQGVSGPASDVVVELQLDAVPVGTPSAIVEKIKGGADKAAAISELLPEVVKAGPVLSVTRLQGGGDLIGVSNLSDLVWVSDPDMTDSGARFLKIDSTGDTLRVSGQSESSGEPVSLRAECPG